MPSLAVAELVDRFPDFRVALIVAEDLRIGEARSALLQGEIEAIEAECRRRWAGVELSAIPGVAAWRSAYKGFGIKRTSYRSAVERLIKRVLAGGALPPVNPLVDLYNAISLQSARSSTPMRAMCCAGDGTGARTRAPPFRPAPAAPRSPSSPTASATWRRPRTASPP